MRYLTILIIALGASAFGQEKELNDTITFKTGYDKTVEIDSFSTSTIYYEYYNKTKDQYKKGQTNVNQVKRFVIYDEEGMKTYDSFMDYTGEKPKVKVDSLKIAEHDLSVNPFLVALLSPSIRYTWKFGNYMEWGLNTRMTYLSPILYDGGPGVFMIGVGPRYMPYYSRKFCFGIDLTPMLLTDFNGNYGVILPIGFDFDFYFGDRFGLAVDFGVGYSNFGDGGYSGIGGRGNIGFLMRMGKRYNVPNASNSVK